MDLYLKMIGIAAIGILLSMILAKNSKDYCFVITILVCCGLCVTTVNYLSPVFKFLNDLEDLVGNAAPWLVVLTKAVGLSLIGETVSSICSDAGHAAVGKSVQLFTTVVIMYISIPLIQNLLELIGSVLELL